MSGTALSFTFDSPSSSRARMGTLTLPHGITLTPIFMPVGTNATIKGLSASSRLCSTECTMLLGNTYHLSQRPGHAAVAADGGIHKFMNYKGPNHNVLTDSGGFQMVSLIALSQLTEEGVTFESPVDGSTMLLTPEASIRAQHDIGADVIMALDDVVSSVTVNEERFREATDRTLRWLDRCLDTHEPRKDVQALFAIVQGGLDVQPGGLRDVCLRGFEERDHRIPGYAIGGVAGGEGKDSFWRVVEYCTRRLPANKPRYLMGVGDPLDLVVCVAFGVDMFDCVFPTRTARFGSALTKFGTFNLKHADCIHDSKPVEEGCTCFACDTAGDGSRYYSRALLNQLFKSSDRSNVAGSMLSHHNIAYMLRLCKEMRQAISDQAYDRFAFDFLRFRFDDGKTPNWCVDRVPSWVKDALKAAGVSWTQFAQRQ